jgi:hypothetical protein
MKWLLLLLTLPLPLFADTIYLTNGKQLEGVIEGEQGGVVTVRMRQGTVKLDENQISRVVRSNGPITEFERRSADLKQRGNATVTDWLDLATYAEVHNMKQGARDAYAGALQVDPDNPSARSALGYKFFNGAWLTPTEYARAQGMVRYNNAWMTPEQVAKIKQVESDTQKENERAAASADAAQAIADQLQSQLDRTRRYYPYAPYNRSMGGTYTRSASGYTRQGSVYLREVPSGEPPIGEPIFTNYSTVLQNY